jgi:hypothetical protein
MAEDIMEKKYEELIAENKELKLKCEKLINENIELKKKVGLIPEIKTSTHKDVSKNIYTLFFWSI